MLLLLRIVIASLAGLVDIKLLIVDAGGNRDGDLGRCWPNAETSYRCFCLGYHLVNDNLQKFSN